MSKIAALTNVKIKEITEYTGLLDKTTHIAVKQEKNKTNLCKKINIKTFLKKIL